jgi:hypothetical protein
LSLALPGAFRRLLLAPSLARRLQRFALAVLAHAELDRRQQGQWREQQAEPHGRACPCRRFPQLRLYGRVLQGPPNADRRRQGRDGRPLGVRAQPEVELLAPEVERAAARDYVSVGVEQQSAALGPSLSGCLLFVVYF